MAPSQAHRHSIFVVGALGAVGNDTEMKAGSAAGDAHGVARADISGEPLLERGDARAEAENRRVEYGVDRVHLDLSEVGGGHGDGMIRDHPTISPSEVVEAGRLECHVRSRRNRAKSRTCFPASSGSCASRAAT